MQVTIVDFGLGNLRSLEHKLMLANVEVETTADVKTIESAQHLILPGVGHFGAAMINLKNSLQADAIREAVQGRGASILGVCLGMQLLTEWSDESGSVGLGLIPGVTRSLRPVVEDGLPIPHLGWSEVLWNERPGFSLSEKKSRHYYFAHSYFVECPDEVVLATMRYGSKLVAGIASGSAVGVQFHPEKSHRAGLLDLVAILKWQAAL